MTINFTKTLQQCLNEIGEFEKHEFIVYEKEEPRTLENSDEIVEKYAAQKEKVVKVINEKYGTSFDLMHWIDKVEDDVAFFLNEAGSNTLSNAQFKAPYRFLVWLGEKRFIIGIEQKGEGFNAKKINEQGTKENRGGGFAFYRNCRSTVFFDNPYKANTIFLVKNV